LNLQFLNQDHALILEIIGGPTAAGANGSIMIKENGELFILLIYFQKVHWKGERHAHC
jgi:hypothetical protein